MGTRHFLLALTVSLVAVEANKQTRRKYIFSGKFIHVFYVHTVPYTYLLTYTKFVRDRDRETKIEGERERERETAKERLESSCRP